MLNNKKQEELAELLKVIEEKSINGNAKDVQVAMDKFNDYLDKLPTNEREFAFVESMPVIRKIANKVKEQKAIVEEMLDDANGKNVANKAYSKF